MNELVEFATSWKTYLGAVLLFSLAPDMILHLAVLAYPKSHPRRRELVAELKVVPRRERPFWVAEQVTSVLVEGVAERRATAKPWRSGQRSRIIFGYSVAFGWMSGGYLVAGWFGLSATSTALVLAILITVLTRIRRDDSAAKALKQILRKGSIE